MCEKCNEALLAASQAALSLSQAAANFYSINENAATATLAKAAAELFTEVKEEAVDVAKPTAESGRAKQGPPRRGTYFDEESGIIYLHGVAVARIVVDSTKTTH